MSNEKKYVGKGKKSGQYDLVNFSVNLTDLPKEDIYEYNGKKYINLTIGALKEIDKYGKTHSVWVNDYKPEKKADTKQGEPKDQNTDSQTDNDNLPF